MIFRYKIMLFAQTNTLKEARFRGQVVYFYKNDAHFVVLKLACYISCLLRTIYLFERVRQHFHSLVHFPNAQPYGLDQVEAIGEKLNPALPQGEQGPRA